MSTAEPNQTPSTPEATSAVVQSRVGGVGDAMVVEPATRRARAEGRLPRLDKDYQLGPGVERACATQPYQRKPSDPLYRPLRIFTLDPAASRMAGAVATVNVPWEPLEPGPVGSTLEVEVVEPPDRLRSRRELRADLDDRRVLVQLGHAPSPSDRAFHQQMVYAVASTVYAAFQQALGRHVAWGFPAPGSDGTQPTRLLLRPHGFMGPNAFYDKGNGQISFGYFTSDTRVKGRNPPFGRVYTCLSHDIIAHEVAHALLDGLRGRFTHPSNLDVLAFHEGFADTVALFQRFSYREVVAAEIRNVAGRLDRSRLLGTMAQQFADTTGRTQALRTAIDEYDDNGMPRRVYPDTREAHDRGSVLVAALFEAFSTLFQRKTAQYVRLATNGTGALPPGDIPADLQQILAEEASQLANQLLTICIRAIDYCPPIDLHLGEFLRALITADRDLVPDDKWGYREALIDAFWRREIYPPDVESLAEDALLWCPPRVRIDPIRPLTFAELRFEGDPARAAGRDELRRQACTLAEMAVSPKFMDEFGLAPRGHERLRGDEVELPRVESIRSARRVGPDGQIVFDLVAEVTQKRRFRDAGARLAFDFYGGSTIILGPDGTVRYAITKSVLNDTRLEEQRRFIAEQKDTLWITDDADAGLKPRPQLFHLLHDTPWIRPVQERSRTSGG